jgi:1,4-dihydroxy-2-naphthoate octaprenyltransferase
MHWFHICRLWSLTASTVPVTVGAALAACDGRFSWPILGLALLSGWMLQLATNLLNSYGDFLSGVDTAESKPTAPQLVNGTLSPAAVFRAGVGALALGALAGAGVAALTDWRLLFFAAAGVAGAGFYTTGLRYKYAGLGLPLVMLLMGMLMVVASYFAQTRTLTWAALAASLPVTCQVGAILHGNDLRDVASDHRAGIKTSSLLLGQQAAKPLFVTLHALPYFIIAAAVATRLLPVWTLLPFLVLPLSLGVSRDCLRGETRSLEGRSAGIHFFFGVLLTLGLALAHLVSRCNHDTLTRMRHPAHGSARWPLEFRLQPAAQTCNTPRTGPPEGQSMNHDCAPCFPDGMKRLAAAQGLD